MDHGFIRSNCSSSYELYDGAKSRLRVESVQSENFEVKVGVGSMVPPQFPSCECYHRKCGRAVVNKVLYAGDLVFSEELFKSKIDP